MLTVTLLAWLAILIAIALIAGFTLRYGNPPTPTAPRVRRAMTGLLPDLADGTVYELGAGWGNVAVALAAHYPARPVVAVEASPLPWLIARLWAAVRLARNLTVRRADFMQLPLGDAALVVCYLDGRSMAALADKLARELPGGATVITHTFELRGWTARTSTTAPDMYRTPIYVYAIPESLPAPATAGRAS